MHVHSFIHSFIKIYIVVFAPLLSLLIVLYLHCRLKFEEMFNNRIQQMMHSYPLDRVVSNGSLFWSGTVLLLASIIHTILYDIFSLHIFKSSFNHYHIPHPSITSSNCSYLSTLLCSALLFFSFLLD